MKQTICIDFDGVIHDYREGWKDGSIYGNVTPGFFEWAMQMKEHYKLAIFSSRSADPVRHDAMRQWIYHQWVAYHGYYPRSIFDWFEFPREKPPAVVYIDDRAVQFEGNWNVGNLTPEAIRNFKPWNKQ